MLLFLWLFLIPVIQQPAPSVVVVDNEALQKTLKTGISSSPYWEAFRVFASGKIEPLGFRLTQRGTLASTLGLGSTDPFPSPDGRFIAYVENGSLWLWTADSRKARRIAEGAEPDKKFRGVLIHITAWKPDSSAILYHVSENRSYTGEGADTEEFPQSVRKSSEYGHRIFSLKLNSSRSIDLPEYAEKTWLPTGEFLIQEKSGLSIREESGVSRSLASVKEGMELVQVHAASNSPEVAVTQLENGRSRIEKIDLPSQQLTPVSPEGKFADYQRPSISPNGRYIGFVHALDPNLREFVLEGRSVHSTKSFPRAHWIDNETVALIDGTEIVVVKASTGNVVTRFVLPSK
jgi:hypothetical protein